MKDRKPTFTFVILVTVAALAAYGALVMTSQTHKPEDELIGLQHQIADMRESVKEPSKPVESIDTTDWKTYTDREYFLSFKYPPNWQVQTYPDKAGYYIIVLKPNVKADNIRIYVSPTSYFAMTGLPTKKDTLAGINAINVNNMLYGVQYAAQYYTFDQGVDTKLALEFQTILSTVAFAR